MKLNKYLMLGLAGLAFTACSNDDDLTSESREDGKVRVTLSLGKTVSARSLGATAEGQYNNITDLKIIFYNSKGAFVTIPDSGYIGGVKYDNATAVNNAVKDGLNNSANHQVTVELKEIPSSATQIYIVTNQEGKSGQVGTTSLDAAKKTTIFLKNQIKTDFKVFSGEDSRMTGLAQIEADGTAKVQLRPAPSRIEMGKVTAIPIPTGETWGGASIKEFKVSGFYINAFRPSGYLDAAQEEISNAIDFENDANHYSKTYYTDNGEWGMMCDEPTDANYTYKNGDNTNTVYTATPSTATNWFGHMILQGTPCDVIVKLSVTYDDNTTADKFLTITKYKYASGIKDDYGTEHIAGSYVNNFLRGHVYKLNDITFDVTDLTDSPYETTQTITATVEVRPWIGVPVTPEFN